MATKKPGLGSIPSGLAAAGEASNLSLGVDTTGVDAAKPALDAFVTKTDEAARAADRLSSATVAQSRAMKEGVLSDTMAPIVHKYTDALRTAGEETDNFRGFTARAKTEVLVLLSELSRGRERQFVGSLLVMAELTGLASVAFSAMGAAVLTALAPLGLYVAGLALGQKAQKEFNDSLLRTSNYAGQTNDSVRELQIGLHATTGVTLTTARDIVESLTATGRVTQEVIAPLAETIARVSRISNESADQIQKDFIKLVDAPTKWALESDKAYHAVNVLIYENIRTLEEHGRKNDAALLAAKALTEHFRDQQAPAVGFLTERMHYLRNEFSDIYQFMDNIGRDKSFGDKLDEINAKLRQYKELREKTDSFNSSVPGGSGAVNAELERQTELERTALLYAEAGKKRQAYYAAESAQTQEAGKEASQRLHALDERIKGNNRLQLAFEKLAQDEAAEVKAHQDAGDKNFEIDKKVHDARVAQLERDNIPQRVRGQITDEDIVKINVDKIKQEFKSVVDSYKDIGIVVAAQNQAGIVDAQDRFAVIKALATATANEEIESLRRQNTAFEAYNATHKGITEQKAVGDNQKQIARNNEEIARTQNKLTAELNATDIAATAYFQHLNAEYLAAQFRAEELLRVTQNQHQITLEIQSLSDRERANKAGIDAINEKARADIQAEEDKRRVLETANQFTATERAQYELRLQLIKDFQERSLVEWTDYFKKLVAAEQDWSNGAQRALQNYIDNAGFTAKNTEQLFNHTFSSMEDALVAFTTGAKVDFKSMVLSFIADLNRLAIQEQLLGPLAKYLKGSSFFGGGDFVSGGDLTPGDLAGLGVTGTAAIGGSFGRGSTIQVNERGPELLTFNDKSVLMMGDNVGRVSPAGSSGGDTNIVFNIASGVSRNELAAMIPALTQHIKTQIQVESKRPGAQR